MHRSISSLPPNRTLTLTHPNQNRTLALNPDSINSLHKKASEIRPTMSLSVLALPLCVALLVNTMGDNYFQRTISEMFGNADFGDFGDVDLEFPPIADEEDDQNPLKRRRIPEMSDNEDFRSFGDDDLLDFGTDDDEEQKVRGKTSFSLTTAVHPVPPWCE